MKVARVNDRTLGTLTSPFGLGGTIPQPALDDISDVDLTGLVDGDTLVWDSGSGTWIPAAGGSLGPLLLSSDHATPIVFEDILQASDGNDFLYASEP